MKCCIFPLAFCENELSFIFFFFNSFSNVSIYNFNSLPGMILNQLSISGLILLICKNFVYSKDINFCVPYVVKYFLLISFVFSNEVLDFYSKTYQYFLLLFL